MELIITELSLEAHSILDYAEFLYLLEKVEHVLNLLALMSYLIETLICFCCTHWMVVLKKCVMLYYLQKKELIYISIFEDQHVTLRRSDWSLYFQYAHKWGLRSLECLIKNGLLKRQLSWYDLQFLKLDEDLHSLSAGTLTLTAV